MKRSILILAMLVAALTPASVYAAGNTYPFPNAKWGLADGVGDGYVWNDFFQGWYQGDLAWYILRNGSNDIRTNQWVEFRSLFPKLGSAIGHGANPVYVVLNFQQSPVFSSAPGNATYSGLWQVFYITWNAGVTPRTITSDLALPLPAEASIVATTIVIDRPIVAIGPLGGPWTPAPPGSYRIPQAVAYDQYDREIQLPFWKVFAQDKIRRTAMIAELLIPDVADAGLATLLKANYAPGLALMDPANTQNFWVFDWTVLPPVPPGQLPIIVNLPNYEGNFGRMNDNYDFSPIMDFTLVIRTGLLPYVVVNNPTFLKNLLPPPLGNGFVTPVGTPVLINAPVFNSYKLRPM